MLVCLSAVVRERNRRPLPSSRQVLRRAGCPGGHEALLQVTPVLRHETGMAGNSEGSSGKFYACAPYFLSVIDVLFFSVLD